LVLILINLSRVNPVESNLWRAGESQSAVNKIEEEDLVEHPIKLPSDLEDSNPKEI